MEMKFVCSADRKQFRLMENVFVVKSLKVLSHLDCALPAMLLIVFLVIFSILLTAKLVKKHLSRKMVYVYVQLKLLKMNQIHVNSVNMNARLVMLMDVLHVILLLLLKMENVFAKKKIKG